jgi:hypothetical protein
MAAKLKHRRFPWTAFPLLLLPWSAARAGSVSSVDAGDINSLWKRSNLYAWCIETRPVSRLPLVVFQARTED